jgi:uncharacterized membrane protein YjjP (DUF1212 family)
MVNETNTKEIQLNPDAEQRRRIMDFVMAAGETLLKNGAEVFRVEQTMKIMAASFHLREFDVYVLTNGIFASAGTAEISEVRNVPTRTIHLGRVAGVNELSRRVAAGTMTLDEAELELVRVQRVPFPSGWMQMLASAMGAFCFSIMFGGSLAAGIVAAAAGFLTNGYIWLCRKLDVPALLQNITGAALITLLSILGCSVLGGSANHAAIGALMMLTPGVAFTTSIRDFVHGDYLSGTIRMIDAILVAASLACGTGFMLSVYGAITGVTVL